MTKALRYRRKAEFVDAIKYTGENRDAVQAFLGMHFNGGQLRKTGTTWALVLYVGDLMLAPGEWVVFDALGSPRVLADSAFNGKYEPEVTTK